MLEKRLQELIYYDYGNNYTWPSVWPWNGVPFSEDPEYVDNRADRVFFEHVDYLIRSESDITALTSPVKYIRECKRWYINAKKSQTT